MLAIYGKRLKSFSTPFSLLGEGERDVKKKKLRSNYASELHEYNGASDRARTGDPRFTRAVLYQLSYAGGHVVTQLRRQRLFMIRDIAHPRKGSDGFSHFKCTNIGDVMSRSYGSQTEWGSHGSTQDSSHAYR